MTRIPTLCVSGEHDRAVTPERSRRTADAIPRARFEILPGAGHLGTVEQPTLATEILRRPRFHLPKA